VCRSLVWVGPLLCGAPLCAGRSPVGPLLLATGTCVLYLFSVDEYVYTHTYLYIYIRVNIFACGSWRVCGTLLRSLVGPFFSCVPVVPRGIDSLDVSRSCFRSRTNPVYVWKSIYLSRSISIYVSASRVNLNRCYRLRRGNACASKTRP